MAIVVGTNSYVTEAELSEYATTRGITIYGDTEILLIKAMDYIESRFFMGEKTDQDQALEFPRNDDTEVPQKIKTAQIVTALKIDEGVDLFANSTQSIKRQKVDGAVEIEYQDYTSSKVSYPQIDILLAPFLASSGSSFEVYLG